MTRYEYVKTVLEPRFRDNRNELYHHGILGQKWGIRRYQNEDGSLTPEGRERYGRALYMDLKKADEKGTVAINRIAKNNKALREYNRTSKTKKLMHEVAIENNKRAQQISDEINKELLKKYGNSYSIEYIIDGITMIKERTNKDEIMNQTKNKYDRLSKQYEKEVENFIKDLLGDKANVESKDATAIKYNKDTGEVSKQTLAERLTIEMLRNAGVQL